MSLTHLAYRTDRVPPRPEELVTATAEAIRSDAWLDDFLGAVYDQREPAAKQYPFVSVARPVGPPMIEDASRVLRIQMYLRAEVAGTANVPDRILSRIHLELFRVVNGASLTLESSDVAVAPVRIGTPTAAAYDADDAAYYSTAIYLATIQPAA